MYMISAHFSIKTFERYFHVGDIVFSLLQQLQFSPQGYLFTITEPISDDRFTPIDATNTKNVIILLLEKNLELLEKLI